MFFVPDITWFKSYKTMPKDCKYLYLWFCNKYQPSHIDSKKEYKPCKPIIMSTIDIEQATDISNTNVKVACSYLYLNGYLKVFKEKKKDEDGGYTSRNIYIPICIWSKDWQEKPPTPIPIDKLLIKEVNGEKRIIKYGAYVKFNEEREF